jgi:type II secretory pathway component HofQ
MNARRALAHRHVGLAACAGLALAASSGGEARVSLDAKDAPVQDVVGVCAELAGLQVVFDPGVECKLTLKLHEARWLTVLDTTLRACGLGYEEEGGILRVAKSSRLKEEAADRRRLNEERRGRGGSGRIALFRLSYARAQELAPLLKSRLAPNGDVTWDPRTNTLIVIE